MVIVEGECPTQESIQDHPTAPYVHLRTSIQPGTDAKEKGQTVTDINQVFSDTFDRMIVNIVQQRVLLIVP